MRRRRGREGGGGKRKRREKEEGEKRGEEGGSLGGLPWVQLGTIMGKRSWVCRVAGIYGPSENSSLAGAMREKTEPYCPPYPMSSPLHRAARGEGGSRDLPQPARFSVQIRKPMLSPAILRHGFLSPTALWSGPFAFLLPSLPGLG